MSVTYDALGAIFISLTQDRKTHVSTVAETLVKLRLPKESVDAILAAVILEVAETQYVEDGGAAPPIRDATIDVLRPLIESKSKKAQSAN